MEEKKHKRLRWLSLVVIAYMLLALGWWSYLLYLKNNDAYHAKLELLEIKQFPEGIPEGMDWTQHPAHLSISQQYRQQERMIMGEAIVLAITLIIGVWFINMGYQRQVEAARQSRNFLLSITHELKSPLASIKLILQTFTKRELPQAQVSRYSQNALSETDRLETLVENLLLAARMENTTIEIHPEPLPLRPMLQGIIQAMQTKHPEATIRLDMEAEAHIHADAKGMASVFTNLLENALKYSDAPQHIAIRHERLKRSDEITVADNGWGIPKAERERVFQKFYRVGNEDTRKTQGTGLGLYIIQQIIAAHKGTIRLEAQESQGTVFRILLPRG